VFGCASKQGTVCSHTLEKCRNFKWKHIAFSGMCARTIEAITMVRQSRRVQPNGQEMREVMGANRVVLSTRQARNAGGEPMGDEEGRGDRGDGDQRGGGGERCDHE